MKNFFAIAFLAVAAIAMTACGSKNAKLSLVANGSATFSAEVSYPENAFTAAGAESGGVGQVLTDSVKNVKMTFRLAESMSFSNKQYYADHYSDTFKEMKVGQYDAFAYQVSKDAPKDYYITILLEDVADAPDRVLTVVIEQLNKDNNGQGGKEFFEQNEDVASVVNSLVYNAAGTAEAAK